MTDLSGAPRHEIWLVVDNNDDRDGEYYQGDPDFWRGKLEVDGVPALVRPSSFHVGEIALGLKLLQQGKSSITELPEFTSIKTAGICRWTAPEIMNPPNNDDITLNYSHRDDCSESSYAGQSQKRLLDRGDFGTEIGDSQDNPRILCIHPLSFQEKVAEDALKYPPLLNATVLLSKTSLYIPGVMNQLLTSVRYSFF
ncbi:uncharacterized protein LACBIDRAFT_321442 [Laccaria bicolor S238N-H82]|uniref:Predicted protein n=1 Tax=Laccaria bicolor (strain S238N-H82 / ATCC MYA-4686) TaxID=486041 RepID=B0CQD7_LACBS|nr:uncharacterized protein LACBIDRAFT_321442 [Laccaria bicolor S238N-H82]EDR16189.1 predicted protein [Laccaria bicolor S238N-H82]|eukprot:XP_001874397.1 predicted protein [Laccaria bicolor S238N-H82]